jgi:hypothetical protein
VFDPVVMPKTYESGSFKTCLDLIITSLSLSLHSLALCDLPIGAFFKTSMVHPGRLEHGPLEKFGFCGLIDGLFMFNKIFLLKIYLKNLF